MGGNRRRGEFREALKRLKEAYSLALFHREDELFPFLRDSVIQRFEIAVELMWKAVRERLIEEGIECRSPKGCVRAFFEGGFVDGETAGKLLKLIDLRNLTSRTYNQEVAQELFEEVGRFLKALEQVEELINKSSQL
ncbi:HI0074 family nucleotidyltransferase substrate-binding subunit [Thermovibrio ammonificans]|jgi:nucleotidyltransferase substrate binding protein (TIGR01987 family)